MYFNHPPSTLQIITVDFLYPQCELVWCSCTIHHVLCTMVWCTSIMHYATCILVQCTSTINHALCTLVHYISTMHCVASIGSLPPRTVYLGTMHSNNESCIVHIGTLDFHYALCSFLGWLPAFTMHHAAWNGESYFAQCTFVWSNLTVHVTQFTLVWCNSTMHLAQFTFLRCTSSTKYEPCTLV